MFLLIRYGTDVNAKTTRRFTFQYVSINTEAARIQQATALHLHSNMFLLIPERSGRYY